jgi:carbon monoxide dehydrogenase subunit G
MKLNVRRTFTTPTDPSTVFAFLGDFRNAEQWDPGTQTCSLVGGEVGPTATYRNVSKFLGRKTELTYTTVTYEPAGRLHFQGRNDSFTGDDRLTFEPEGTGTKVEYHATFELKGAAALAVPLVAAYLPALATKTIKQLKASLDGLPARTG